MKGMQGMSGMSEKKTTPQVGETFKDCPDCPEMIVLKGGSFKMGSEKGDDDEKPVHEVNIKPFAIGKFEVTKGQFAKFVEKTNYQTEAETGDGCHGWVGTTWEKKKEFNWRKVGLEQGDDHPVVCVSWNDATKYAQWLSKETGKQYRLPTEAEWEYSARAGTTTERFWGDNADEACGYANVADQTAKKQFKDWSIHNCKDGYVFTAPVGRFKASGFGLYDVLGNVSEWTCSDYGEYSENNHLECSGNNNARLSVRGGSWYYDGPWRVRSANRLYNLPDDRYFLLGFRLSRIF
jgi:formylglycine-generating enzyme required for sulfatase activity